MLEPNGDGKSAMATPNHALPPMREGERKITLYISPARRSLGQWRRLSGSPLAASRFPSHAIMHMPQ